MEPMPSQVRNHHSQNNQEAHLERALAFQKAAIHHGPSNVWLPIICLASSYCRWQMSPFLFLIKRLLMTKVRTPGSPWYHSPLETIWINSRTSDISASCARTSHYKQQAFISPRTRALPIQSLHALRFQISETQLGQWHHHCSHYMQRRHVTRDRVSAIVYRSPLRHWALCRIYYHCIVHIYSLPLVCNCMTRLYVRD